jgi:hypothetical protein
MIKRKTMMVHLCAWPNCRRPVPFEMWGCKTHWYTLPTDIRDEIWQGYGHGKLSPEWIAANERAREWIRGIPERAQDTHDITPLRAQGENDVDSDQKTR